jgi:hypothetical protein
MVRFELNNGGAIIPVVAGSEANIQDSFDLRPAPLADRFQGR